MKCSQTIFKFNQFITISFPAHDQTQTQAQPSRLVSSLRGARNDRQARFYKHLTTREHRRSILRWENGLHRCRWDSPRLPIVSGPQRHAATYQFSRWSRRRSIETRFWLGVSNRSGGFAEAAPLPFDSALFHLKDTIFVLCLAWWRTAKK